MISNYPARHIACAFLLIVAVDAYADKTDIVEFGKSRMVGEVKRLDRGKLHFKTDATNTIEIDWDDVTLLVTDQRLRVERRNGSYSFGSFVPGAEPRALAFSSGGEVSMQQMRDVVAFEPVKADFWDRLDIKTSVGYSNTNSNNVEQLNFDATFTYDTERRSRELNLSTQSSDSEGSDASSRTDVSYHTLHYRQAKWFTGWLADYEKNDELDLDYRFTGASVFGREFYPRTNRRFRAFSGLALSEEAFAGSDANSSVLGVLGGSVDWFRFSTPELDLSSKLILFPSFTDWGRVRGTFDISARWEIVEDLFWQLSLYDDYDSEPLDENGEPGSAVNDYGITTSLGWSW